MKVRLFISEIILIVQENFAVREIFCIFAATKGLLAQLV